MRRLCMVMACGAGINLDQVPESGGVVWVTFPKVDNGSGFPARVIAVVP